MKLRAVDATVAWAFFCPACGHNHVFFTVPHPSTTNKVWTMEGTPENPTFKPSLKNEIPGQTNCHLNVTDGKIYYHGDSTHSLRGQTVDMVDLKDEEYSD